MTERNQELKLYDKIALALLNNEAFVEALATEISRYWGLGDSPSWFFDRLVKKVRASIPTGSFDADVLPTVFLTPEDKEIASRTNDLKSLRYTLEVLEAKGREEQAAPVREQLAMVEARLEELKSARG